MDAQTAANGLISHPIQGDVNCMMRFDCARVPHSVGREKKTDKEVVFVCIYARVCAYESMCLTVYTCTPVLTYSYEPCRAMLKSVMGEEYQDRSGPVSFGITTPSSPRRPVFSPSSLYCFLTNIPLSVANFLLDPRAVSATDGRAILVSFFRV